MQDASSGRFILSPASPANSRFERELNGNALSPMEMAERISQFRAAVVVEELEYSARCADWNIARFVKLGRDAMHRFFSKDTLRVVFYKRRSWNPRWLMAFTSGIQGDTWWIVDLRDKSSIPDAAKPYNIPGDMIRAVYRIPREEHSAPIMESSQSTLESIEKTSVAMISLYANAQSLATRATPHSPKPEFADGTDFTLSTLQTRLETKQASLILKSPIRLSIPSNNGMVSVAYNGLDLKSYSAVHVVTALSTMQIPSIARLTSALKSSMSFHPTNGSFAFRLFTPVGNAVVPSIFTQLSAIDRLLSHLQTIRKHGMRCDSVSLKKIDFTYSIQPTTLSATVQFAESQLPEISFSHNNPHLTIQNYLTTLLRSPKGLNQVLFALKSTLPLLRALSSRESLELGLTILPRSAERYIVTCAQPRRRFEIKLQQRQAEIAWLLKATGGGEVGAGPEAGAENHVPQGFEGAKGREWRAMKDGLVASTRGVEPLIRRIMESLEAQRKGGGAPREETEQGRAGMKRKADAPIKID